MAHSQIDRNERRIPTHREAIAFRLKSLFLQARRSSRDLLDRNIKRFPTASSIKTSTVLGESRTPLWTEHDPREKELLAGKIHNLRLAIRRLDGLEVAGGEVFSFWKHVGRTSRFRGFVEGRELREGCIIPNVGGGLCQLSNALYDAALKADFDIVERHAHTQVVAGSLAEEGRDATVFWNYVDLRFRSAKPFRIEARLDGRELAVRYFGEKNGRAKNGALPQISKSFVSDDIGSCVTCEVGDCHRVVERPTNADFGTTAFLVDEYWPEFDEYIQANKKHCDALFIPIDGRRFRKANYAWTTNGFAKVTQSFYVTAARSYSSRKLAAQGASRQRNLLRNYERLAETYSRRLSYDMLHVVVQQDLLPFLWRAGHLGGRTFDVLMTALPMYEIQRRLDNAKSLHPESKTLADFRADDGLVEAEREALKNARRIVTPHSEIASMFLRRGVLVDWQKPVVPVRNWTKNEKPVVVFPASTVGRKGCYEVRAALEGLDVRLIRLGPDIEGEGFWSGLDTIRGDKNAIESADVVVLPAFVEHRPRRLIHAAASGIPVIASSACGLKHVSGVETIEASDTNILRQKILQAISS